MLLAIFIVKFARWHCARVLKVGRAAVLAAAIPTPMRGWMKLDKQLKGPRPTSFIFIPLSETTLQGLSLPSTTPSSDSIQVERHKIGGSLPAPRFAAIII